MRTRDKVFLLIGVLDILVILANTIVMGIGGDHAAAVTPLILTIFWLSALLIVLFLLNVVPWREN